MIESSVYSLARNSAVANPVRTDNMESLAPNPAANTARPMAEDQSFVLFPVACSHAFTDRHTEEHKTDAISKADDEHSS